MTGARGADQGGGETNLGARVEAVGLDRDFPPFGTHEMGVWEEGADLLRPLRGVGSMWQRHVGSTTRREAARPPQAQRLVQLLRETAQKFSRR